jgi:hypothetical protein
MNTTEERRVLKLSMPRNIEDGGTGKSEILKLGLQGTLASKINKSHTAYWVVEALKNQVAPDGTSLRSCTWHSGCNSGPREAKIDPNNPDKCCSNPVPLYGIWLTGYECLDTCWFEAEAQRQKSIAESRQNNLLLETFDTWAPQSISMHKDFMDKVEKSRKLRNERDRVQRELAKLVQGPDLKNPQYQQLVDLKKRADQQLEWVRTQIGRRWKSDMEVTEEEFIRNGTYKETLEVQKAADKVSNWVNRGAVPQNKIDEVSDNLRTLESELAGIETNIRETVKLPFYFARRAYNQLTKLRWFVNNWMCYNQRSTNKEKIEREIAEYLATLSTGLNMYGEWIPLEEQDGVYWQVNKEQEEAAAEEANRRVKAIRELSNQQTAVLGEFIIDVDGSVIEIAPAHSDAPATETIVTEATVTDPDLVGLPTMSANRRLKLLQQEASEPKQVITLQGKISMSTNTETMKVMSTAESLEQYERDEEDEEDWRAGRYSRYDDYDMRTGSKARGSRSLRNKTK